MMPMPPSLHRFGTRLLTVALSAIFGVLLLVPLPVWAQDSSTASDSNGASTLVSLFLLVVGLLAIAIVGYRVIVAPGARPRLDAIDFEDDNDEDEEEAATEVIDTTEVR